MSEVLVTGASGFIGKKTLENLRKHFDRVHAVYNNSQILSETDVTWHKVNLLDTNATSQLIKKIQPSHLLHLAWYAEPGKYNTSLLNIDWFIASYELIKSFKESGGERVVVAGTCFEYDLSVGFLSEDSTPKLPSSIYGLCKRNLQETLQAYSENTDLSYAWGRVFYLYGPYEYRNRLVSSVILSLLNNKPAKSSLGFQKKDFLHVQDVANAFVALLLNKIEGPVNIGSGMPVSVRNIVLKIGEILGKEELIELGALPVRENEPPLVMADNRKLLHEVGWEQEYDIDRGLEDTIEWWKEHKA